MEGWGLGAIRAEASNLRVRNLRDTDLPRLEALHRQQGYDYIFPDLSQPEFVAKQTIVDELDRPVVAVVARKTVELYLLCDSEYGTPGLRWMGIKAMHEEVSKELRGQGFTDAHAWIPPQIETQFTRRLKRMGWTKAAWNCYARPINE